jgi:hypothetical protein
MLVQLLFQTLLQVLTIFGENQYSESMLETAESDLNKMFQSGQEYLQKVLLHFFTFAPGPLPVS